MRGSKLALKDDAYYIYIYIIRLNNVSLIHFKKTKNAR
jgi:hypothetical protein